MVYCNFGSNYFIFIMKNIIRHILLFISHYSSKLNVWSWQMLWGNTDTGYGYKKINNK